MSLHWKIIIGLVAGVLWALMAAPLGLSMITVDWIKPFGDLFIMLLKLIALPLVLFSVINGVMSLKDIKKLGKMGLKTMGFYLFTTLFSVSVGLLLVNTIKPGKKLSPEAKEVITKRTMNGSSSDAEKLEKKRMEAQSFKNTSPLKYAIKLIVPTNIFKSLGDERLMLHVIFFSLLFGIAVTQVPPKETEGLRSFLSGMDNVILKMMMMIMRFAPFFVFALMAGTISEMAGDDIGAIMQIFEGLGWFSITVLIGLIFMAFVLYPFLVKLFAKKSPKEFLKGIRSAQALAFSSSSSAATLPVTMHCVNKNLGVSEETTSFVLPIGATVNMDGTSLYQGVTVVFLAQFFGVELSFAQQLMIVGMSTLASIGSPAVPSAGLVMLIMVMESVGLNSAWIALVFPIDRILDMCRTVVNVTGDATVSSIIDYSNKDTKISA
jgi:Na+/H+-dicarboxylate symporter